MMRIGVYTGSFDPIHKGHIKIVKTILKKGIVDKVFIIPSNDYWDKKLNMSMEDRTELIRISLKNKVSKSKYMIDGELGKVPYTYMLIRELKKLYPDDEFYLILGGDNIENFKNWNHYKELLTYGFIVVNRNIPDLEDKLKKLGPRSYALLEIDGIGDISSTYIRENLDDYSKIRKMIDPEEYEFVRERLK